MLRKAVVIVPSEEDYKARGDSQEKAECKDVPDTAVMEMKGTSNSTRIEQRTLPLLHIGSGGGARTWSIDIKARALRRGTFSFLFFFK